MPARFAYHGRYLRIDLTTRTSRAVSIDDRVLRRYIGGSGLGTWILLRETPPDTDAFSPEAPLAFAFSPLVGSPLTTSAKFAVLAKSPLTDRLNDSLASSAFAISGKATGYDAIVLVGAAERLTGVVVEPDGVRFESVEDLAGMSIPETQAELAARWGTAFRTAVIGPAGENRVRYATISHDGRHAGRGGLGAVMGAKRVKALAVRGDRRVEWAHAERLAEYGRELSKASFGPATAKYRELGTVSNLLTFNRLGTLPTRNFQSGTFADAEALAPETLNTALVRTRKSCAACTIGCEHIYELPADSPSGEGKSVRMEYENLFALGPLCGVGDPRAVLAASSFCDEQGMDTISAGGTIAFAMECAERGLIDAPDLRFGNGDALLETLRSISSREGLGDLLADGTRRAAEQIGGGSADFALHVKGLEIPGYEPRALQSMALGFAVNTRGADHNRSGAYQADFSADVDRLNVTPEDVHHAVHTEDEAAAMDALILCKFLRGVFDDRFAAMAEMLRLVTGWEIDGGELLETCQRIINAKKWYNIRQGWTPAEDTLPPRFLEEELPDEKARDTVLTESRLRGLVAAYNKQRGWSEDGWLPETVTAELMDDL